MNPGLFRLLPSAALLAVFLLAACDDSTAPPQVPVTRSITVDASAGPAYLALDTVASTVTVATPATSTTWDMSFAATAVTLNGGAAGPGGVSAHCLCANRSATTAELQAMTPDNQLAAFEAVTAADIPPAAAFRTDSLDPVFNGWFTGTPGVAGVAPSAGRAWIVREGSGGGTVLAKVAITDLTAGTATTPGSVTFQYAVQPSSGAAFGATQTTTVNPAAGAVYFDLTTGQVSTSASYDLRFEGWTITVNGGVSGGGTIAAVVDTQTPFANIDAAYAGTVPPQAFRSDRFSGVFGADPWYRYNITGTDNQIWPTFNVYLVRRGNEVYKVQLTGYYSLAAAPRNITIRYAQIAR